MPLHMMILLQHVSTPSPSPPAFRCRQILPASGTVSVSVWDGSGDAAMLKDYLDGVLNGDASPGDPLYWRVARLRRSAARLRAHDTS